jgi:hypothetical protein
MRAHDVVSIHLPQVEAAPATLLARLAGHRPVITYHCDLQMPPVWYGKIVDKATFWDNLLAGKLADTIVAYTEDFARHSPFLSRFLAADDTVTRGHGDTVTRGHGDKGTLEEHSFTPSRQSPHHPAPGGHSRSDPGRGRGAAGAHRAEGG